MPEDPLTPRLLQNLRQAPAQHLSYQQMAAYVDAQLEDTEAQVVRAHAELCARCASELDHLTSFARASQAKEPHRPAPWTLVAQWIKIPRHSWALGAVAAIVLAIIAVPARKHSAPTVEPPAIPMAAEQTFHAAPPPVEAVLDPVLARVHVPRGATFEQNGRRYRVLTQPELDAYRKELAAAPDDPAAKGAIAIKYALFTETEKQYQQVMLRDPEMGRRLLQELNRVRGR